MAHKPANASRLPRIWLPAMVVSFVTSLLCATALYLLLVQHDRSLTAESNAAALGAAESSGRAVARTFASFSESLLGEHLANIQQTLEGQAQPSDLLDAAVITDDNFIVAARNPAAIGRQFQDASWPAARKNQAGSVSAALERGRRVLIVIEPLHRQERIIGWVRLIFVAPPDVSATRSNQDLLRDVALAILPLFVLTATLLILFLRGIMSRIRSLIGRILLDAMGDSRNHSEKTVGLSKAG